MGVVVEVSLGDALGRPWRSSHRSLRGEPLKVGSGLRWESFKRESELITCFRMQGRGSQSRQNVPEGCNQTLPVLSSSPPDNPRSVSLFSLELTPNVITSSVGSSGVSPGVPRSVHAGPGGF